MAEELNEIKNETANTTDNKIDVDKKETSGNQAKKRVSQKKKTARSKKGARSKPTRTSVGKAAAQSPRPFPSASFEEALTIPNAIQKHAPGLQKVRRLTLFDAIGKSPDSGPSRQLITNSNKYGLTTGSYQADFLELTEDGKLATGTEVSQREKLLSRFKLAIRQIAPFNAIYESLKGNRLPATSVLEDIAKDSGVSENNAKVCVETFIVNAKFLGILKPIAGAERVIPIEQVSEELPSRDEESSPILDNGGIHVTSDQTPAEHDWGRICFYISPIGEEDSEDRKHADLFLGSIIEPALEEFGLKVVRADRIGKPGMITSQILEYILKSKLVVADLSFHNPNVFYELALRHISRLPIVQVIRTRDRIPFDLDQFRTIQIDTSDIYSLVPNLQTYKAEISTQVRAALKGSESVDNPLSIYYPNLKVIY